MWLIWPPRAFKATAWRDRGVRVKGLFVEPCHHLYSAGSKSPRLLLKFVLWLVLPEQWMTMSRDAEELWIYIEMAPRYECVRNQIRVHKFRIVLACICACITLSCLWVYLCVYVQVKVCVANICVCMRRLRLRDLVGIVEVNHMAHYITFLRIFFGLFTFIGKSDSEVTDRKYPPYC